MAAGFLAVTLVFSPWTAEPQSAKWLAVFILSASALPFVRLYWPPLLILGWMGISLIWSPDWRTGLSGLIHASALYVAFLWAQALKDDWAEKIAPAAAIACAAVAVLWFFPLGREMYAGFGNRNFATEFVMILTPFVWLSRRTDRRLCAAGFLGIVAILVVNPGAYKWLALVLLAGFFLFLDWRRGGLVTTVLAFVFIASFPFIDFDRGYQSLLGRLEFVYNGRLILADAPFVGHGFGSLNFVYPDYAERHVGILGDTSILSTAGKYIGALHNDPLQLAIELGLIGALLVLVNLALIVAWVLIRKKVGALDGIDRASIAALAIWFALSLVAFPAQNAGTAFLGVVCLGLLARGIAMPFASIPIPKPILVCGSLGFLYYAWMIGVSDHLYGKALRSVGSDPLAALVNAVEAHKANPLAREPRHQLIFLANTLGKRSNVTVDPETADLLHKVSRSAAGNDPGIMVARLEYLINAGRNQEEAAQIIFHLTEKHKLLPETQAALDYLNGARK